MFTTSVRAGLLAGAALLAVGLLPAIAEDPQDSQAAHPDFTGVWTTYVEPGKGFGFGPPLPFKKAAQAKVDEYRSLTSATMDNPSAHCLGAGMPGSMQGSGAYPMEIIQRPEQITVIYEAHTELRRIYMTDKLKPEDRLPSRNGYSRGHWEGDTLVVDTTNLEEQVDQRYAHSANAKIVEKYHVMMDDKGTKVLVDDFTLTDPDFYKKPVSDEKKWAYVPNGIMLPYECEEEGWLDHLADLKAKADAAAKAAKDKGPGAN
jgi:hypothetical protein